MSTLKKFIAAATLVAGLGFAGAASAAPALGGSIGIDTATKTDSAVQPVYYGYNCYPVYRWVYTYNGWQQVYVGQRCPGYNPYYYGGPRIRFNIRL